MAYPTVAEIQDRFAYMCDDPQQKIHTNAYFQRAFNAAYDVLWQAFLTNQSARIELMVNFPLVPMTTELTPAAAGIMDFGDQIFLRERNFGSNDKYTDLVQVDVLSQRQPTDKLIEVNWRNNTWYFIGATNMIDLEIKYESSSVAPIAQGAGLNTQVMVDNSCEFLALFSAARSLKLKGRTELANDYFLQAVGPKYQLGTVGGALFMLVQPPVRGRQLSQVAPKPYQVSRRLSVYRQVPYVGAQQGTTGGGSQNVPVQYSSAQGSIVGQIDGINLVFWLVVGVTSMQLYRNGVLQTVGTDYTFVSNQITFLSGSVPQPGDILTADAFPVYSGQGNFGSVSASI